MAVDGLILNKYVEDLKSLLPFKINKINQISNNEILLQLRVNREKKQLIISTHSLYNRIHFTNKHYPNSLNPTNFLTNLRKHLENGTVYDIKQGGKDRYLTMEIAHRDELKDKKLNRLFIELMGKYANIILVNEEDRIIDALKKIPPFENSKRTILPNAIYTYPEPQTKKDPYTTFDIDNDISLVQQFHGFSPLLAKEVNHRLRHNNFESIMKEIMDSKSIYVTKINNTFEYHLIPLSHINIDYEQKDLHLGLDEMFFELEEKARIKEVTNDIEKFVKRNLKQLQNKLPKLQSSLEEAFTADIYKEQADLIFTYYHDDITGLNEITIVDYNDDEHHIVLDPKLSVKRNAKKLYTKYQKGKKAIEHLNKQIKICEDEINYFKGLLEQLEYANYNDAKEIKLELIKNNYLRDTIQLKKKKNDEIKVHTIEFKNQTIIYGKNNLQNDLVTWKLARKNDTWFHTKDYHGSHVVVKNDNLDEETIRFCANLAAYYSKGRMSSSVPVDYCLVKNLKKIPGSKAGLVSMSTYKTIFIDPDIDLIKPYLD